MLAKFIGLLSLFISCHALADLRPYHLEIKLSSDKSAMKQGGILPLWLEFTNPDTVSHTYILPSNDPSRKKVVFFSVFSVDEHDFYTEVFRESMEITMDTALQVWHNLRNVRGGESIKFPVYFNDERNFNTHIEAHHRLSSLPPGNYQMLAWYQPWYSDLSRQIYNPISPFGHDESEHPDAYKLDMPTDGLQSNYMALTILPEDGAEAKLDFQHTAFCSKNCSFCKKIDKNKWRKVQRSIKRQTSYRTKFVHVGLDSNWRQAHRGVAFLGPNPEAILASLPSWTGRNIIFLNEDGYHYFTMRWQLGKIHKIRSKMAYPFYWIGFRRPPFSTSFGNYKKLVTFKRY